MDISCCERYVDQPNYPPPQSVGRYISICVCGFSHFSTQHTKREQLASMLSGRGRAQSDLLQCHITICYITMSHYLALVLIQHINISSLLFNNLSIGGDLFAKYHTKWRGACHGDAEMNFLDFDITS